MSISFPDSLKADGSRRRAVVGMSGGVDSAVTAFLLLRAGFDVTGVTLRMFQEGPGNEKRMEEIRAAADSAERLGIPFITEDCAEDFRKNVSEPFVREYLAARTPNPCVECNRAVKWNGLMRAADRIGADLVATGHYAHVIQLSNGRYTIKQADQAAKDQTYVLFRLTQEQLAKTFMPLGSYDKAEVRKIAEEAGLAVARKADSQEICFITYGHYADYIENEMQGAVPGPGNFVDAEGKILGKHKGITHYTVGQRKGLGLPLGYHAYVTKIRPETNEVVLGREGDQYKDRVLCDRLNFMSIEDIAPGEEIPAAVRIRYHHAGEPAILTRTGEDRLMIRFEKPVRAAAPGQSAVFYDEKGCIIGGGRILGSE